MNRKCFIIMPFSGTETVKTKKAWTDIYNNFFKPAWKGAKFDCERANVKRGSITKDIIEKMFSVDIVMADLTDTNPNVMYELGVRHSFKKPSLMIKQAGCDIPFDVNDYKVHEYENTPGGLKDFKKLIKEIVKDLDENPTKPDNPVWDMIHYGGFMVDYYKEIENKNKVHAFIDEINYNISTISCISDSIDNHSRIKSVGGFLNSLEFNCINHLLTTKYITFSNDEWKTIKKYYIIIKISAGNSPRCFNGSIKTAEEIMSKPFIKNSLAEFEKCKGILNNKLEELSKI